MTVYENAIREYYDELRESERRSKESEERDRLFNERVANIPKMIAGLRASEPEFDQYMSEAEVVTVESGHPFNHKAEVGIVLAKCSHQESQPNTFTGGMSMVELTPHLVLLELNGRMQVRMCIRQHDRMRGPYFGWTTYYVPAMRKVLEVLVATDPGRVMLALFRFRSPIKQLKLKDRPTHPVM